MNIIQIQDRLKGVDDNALIQYVENPNSEVPTYLALGELQRRKSMRDRYESQREPTKTVSEQLVEESLPQGLAAIGVPGALPAEAVDPSMAQPQSEGLDSMPAPNMQEFAGGGIVAFAAGDMVRDPYANLRLDEPAYAQERMQQFRGFLGEDPNQALLQERMAELEKRAGRREERAPGLAMIQAGLGIAAGDSPYALQNIGKGAQAGVSMYAEEMANIDDLRQKQYTLEAERAKIQRAEDIAVANKGADSADAARAQNLKVDLQTEQDRLAREEMLSKERIAETSASAYGKYLSGQRLDLAVDKEALKRAEDRFGPKQKMLEALELSESLGKISVERQLELNKLRAEKQAIIDDEMQKLGKYTTESAPTKESLKTQQTPKTGKKVKRTGIDKTSGKVVVEYEDGTVAYAN
jgi:hypothetical protein